jgi:hypothetical protein
LLSRKNLSRHTLGAQLTKEQFQLVFTGMDCIETVINQLKDADKMPPDDVYGDTREVWNEVKRLWGNHTAGETFTALQFWSRQIAGRMATLLRRSS